MTHPFSPTANRSLEVTDLSFDAAFKARPLRPRDYSRQNELVGRLGPAIEEEPLPMLQGFANVIGELCGADSVGISIECEDEGANDRYFQWVAVAGEYAQFLSCACPRGPCICGICVERDGPQHFRIIHPSECQGRTAPPVTDAILVPWKVESLRGTIVVMAHGRPEAFDAEDCKLMLAVAQFTAVGIKLQREQVRQLWMDDQSSGAA